jgi:hypothetical protein
MTELKATAQITANSAPQEKRVVQHFTAMPGVENVRSTPHGSTFEVTAEAPCNPPRTCGATIFKGGDINNVDRCSGCNRG